MVIYDFFTKNLQISHPPDENDDPPEWPDDEVLLKNPDLVVDVVGELVEEDEPLDNPLVDDPELDDELKNIGKKEVWDDEPT